MDYFKLKAINPQLWEKLSSRAQVFFFYKRNLHLLRCLPIMYLEKEF